MITKKALDTMISSDIGWIQSTHHYSNEDNANSKIKNFGVLKVLNDDIIHPRSGFHNHPQYDMEIISYVVDGELTHGDSMGNEVTLKKGDLQYISAGSGITYEEHNFGNNSLRFIQIWVIPSTKLGNPTYERKSFQIDDRKNQWLYMVSSKNGLAPIKINQDVNIYTAYAEKENNLEFRIYTDRQGYLVQVKGKSLVTSAKDENHNILLEEKDALEIYEDEIILNPHEDSQFLLIEMAKE